MAKNEVYDAIETSASISALGRLAVLLPKPIILLGGWAVYFTVNKSYHQEHGVPYLGSRDVDIGFHVPEGVTEMDLVVGNLKATLEVLRRMGYRKEGPSRLCRTINKVTGENIIQENLGSVDEEDVLHLFVDPIVDN